MRTKAGLGPQIVAIAAKDLSIFPRAATLKPG